MKCPKCNSENPDTQQFCGDCGTQLPESEEFAPSFTKTLETPMEELTTGSTFAGRYQIIEELGKGGMGRVYRVLDRELKEEVALKLIKSEIAQDKKTIERFKNELKTARRISHRNIGRMYELMEANGLHFITMEYVAGQDLRGLIRQTGQLTAGKAISIAKEICEGLGEAHRQGVIHRDLKPSNIIIDKDGNARILDFGIARSVESKGITGAGVMIGTPEYMSPEQVEAKDVDQRSDIYSLGIILYEMATGRLPFEADSAFAVGIKQKSETPTPPKELNPLIPDDLSRVILKCLEKDREKRYQSAGDICSELDALEQGLLTGEQVAPKKKPITSKEITVTLGLKKLLIPVLGLAALIIAVVIIWQLIPKKEIVVAPKIENSIAVISFKNQTGDKAYDYLQEAIPNLLITSLEQAGTHYVMTWERMFDLLKQIGKEEAEAVDRNLGFKICRMEGVESIVLGSYVKAGEMFATDVKVLDVETKKLLKSAGSKGEGEGSIIKIQIDELSKEISKGLGITSRKAIQSLQKISEVTTKSIEAYNFYLKGREAQSKLYWEEANKFYKKAVELDPTFATAYRFLGNSYGWLGNSGARNEAYTKAKSLLENTSGKERLYLEAQIAGALDGDSEKFLTIMKQIAEEYPREKRAHFSMGYYYERRGRSDEAIEEYNRALELDPNDGLTLNQLGYTYADKGNFTKAIEYIKKYASLYPDDANPYDSLGEMYYRMGRLDEAAAKYKEAIQVKSDLYPPYNSIGYIYALKENYPLATQWIEQGYEVSQSPGRQMDSSLWNAFIQYWKGRYDISLAKLQEAEDMADSIDNLGMKNFIEWIRGWIYYEKGQLDLSRKYYKNWLDFSINNAPKWRSQNEAQYNIMLGLIDVKSGQINSAKSKLAEAKSFIPTLKSDPNTRREFLYCLLQGELALAENQPEKAIEIFENLKPIEGFSLDTMPVINHNIPLVKRDILARALQQKGEIDKAVTEYERLITFDPENESRHLIHPIYHYGIAKLYEQKDLKGKAIEHYQKFLDLWKNADPGITEIEDATRRLTALKVY